MVTYKKGGYTQRKRRDWQNEKNTISKTKQKEGKWQKRKKGWDKNKWLEEKEGRQRWKGDTGSYLKLGFVESVGPGNQAAMFACNYVRHTVTHLVRSHMPGCAQMDRHTHAWSLTCVKTRVPSHVGIVHVKGDEHRPTHGPVGNYITLHALLCELWWCHWGPMWHLCCTWVCALCLVCVS